jgi:F-type H+-transporting ATPase subunit b
VLLGEFQLGPVSIEDPKVFVAQCIGFLLFAALLWFVNVPVFSRPALREVLIEREKRVAEVHDQVDTALSETQRLHDEYAARLRNIEAESRERIDAAVREADAAHNEIIADAQRAATLVARRTEEELSKEQTRQRILLRRQIVQISLDAAESTVRSLTSDDVQRHLINDFIVRAAAAPGTEAANG